MEAETDHKVLITLIMSEKEAVWLRNYMQNPRVDLESESPQDGEMRKLVFETLDQEL